MPKLFVHGNPETPALWRPLHQALAARGVRDFEALAPPGFGAPVPEGFEATREAYRDWLVKEIESRGGPVDLVGHDWGAGHVLGLVEYRPDLVRSWATDCAGLAHPDYVWHDMAQAWQTPEVGEAAIAEMLDRPLPEKIEMLKTMGMPADVAEEIAAGQGPEMGRCVLALYRSAAQPVMKELGERLVKGEKRPGHVFIAMDDPFTGTPEMCEAVALSLGASTSQLPGRGHWWMFADLDPIVDALIGHWDGA